MAHTFINAGNKSRWVKYDTRLVWYAPEVSDRATSIALLRISAITSQHRAKILIGSEAPTRSSSAYDGFDGVCELEEDSINLIKTSKHSNDVGAWVSITLRQDDS